MSDPVPPRPHLVPDDLVPRPPLYRGTRTDDVQGRRGEDEDEDEDGLIRRPNGTPEPCDRCGGPAGKIVRYILASGTTQLRWQCAACGRIQLGSLPHAGRDVTRYPIVRDSLAAHGGNAFAAAFELNEVGLQLPPGRATWTATLVDHVLNGGTA
jgi:hypothetical protein